jgi:hypothetical protein
MKKTYIAALSLALLAGCTRHEAVDVYAHNYD